MFEKKKYARHELTDYEWGLIKGLFPRPTGRPGKPWRSHREVMNGILWILKTGAPWRDLPERFGPWQTTYNRFSRYRRDGTIDRIAQRLVRCLAKRKKLDRTLFCVDGSSIRAHRCAAGARSSAPNEPKDHALGRSRGGFGTKIHLLVDGKGCPLSIILTPGQAHESKSFIDTMQAILIPGLSPLAVAGDKGYNARYIREWLADRKICSVIPTKSSEQADPHFDKGLYRRRNVVECCIGWLKEARRIVTRFEKLAVNFLAMLKLAFVLRYFRGLRDRA